MIDLPSFYADFDRKGNKSTTADVAKLVKKTGSRKRLAALFSTWRRNPGGSLTEVINLAGLFLKAGPIVQVKDNDGKISVDIRKTLRCCTMGRWSC